MLQNHYNLTVPSLKKFLKDETFKYEVFAFTVFSKIGGVSLVTREKK